MSIGCDDILLLCLVIAGCSIIAGYSTIAAFSIIPVSFIVAGFFIIIINVIKIIINDICTYKLYNSGQNTIEYIYITDLSEPKCGIIGTFFVNIYKSAFNSISQRKQYVYDISDTDGITSVFRTARKNNKGIMIFIDSLNNNVNIAQTLQNTIRSFRTFSTEKIECCILGNVGSIGTIIGMSSDVYSMDSYLYMKKITSKDEIELLKRSQQYMNLSFLKKITFLRLMCDGKNSKKNIHCLELMNYHVYSVPESQYEMYKVLKILKMLSYK